MVDIVATDNGRRRTRDRHRSVPVTVTGQLFGHLRSASHGRRHSRPNEASPYRIVGFVTLRSAGPAAIAWFELLNTCAGRRRTPP
jgi:hypothetical protein